MKRNPRANDAQREYDDAAEIVYDLRRRVAEGTVNADALAVAEYRLAMASKRLTRAVTTPTDDGPAAA